jgi:hypothetical protein
MDYLSTIASSPNATAGAIKQDGDHWVNNELWNLFRLAQPMKRRLFNILSVLSLVLSIALAIAGYRLSRAQETTWNAGFHPTDLGVWVYRLDRAQLNIGIQRFEGPREMAQSFVENLSGPGTTIPYHSVLGLTMIQGRI